MQERKLTAIDTSLAFFIGFLLSQISVVVVMVIGYIVCIIGGIEIELLQPFLNTAFGYLLCVIAMDLTMFLVFWFYHKRTDEKFISKPKTKKIFLYILLAIISFLALYPIVTCFDSWLVSVGISLNTIPYELNTANYFISILSLVILPAISEELLFRGIIFKGLKRYGKVFSITISSLMFMIFHLSISQTIYPMMFGLMLGVIMYYEDNILYCITAHMTNNFLSLTLSYFNVSLSYNHWSYILIAVILMLVFITVILYFTIKNSKKVEKVKPNAKELTFLIGSLIIMLIIWIANNFFS